MLQRRHEGCAIRNTPATPHGHPAAMTSPRPPALRRLAAALLAATLAATALAPPAAAQSRLARLSDEGSLDDDTPSGAVSLPAGVRVLRDVAYGADRRQRYDVYLPATPPAAPSPVVFFVHGGAWAFGDKAARRVVEPKTAHWVERGWVVVSVDYRLLPTPVAAQADDVAAALASAQAQAARWHADPARFVLMGHSAGAHLVALIAAGGRSATAPQPWRGAVLLDSAVLDLPLLMSQRHAGLYDRAFGRDPAQWPALSPYAALAGLAGPAAPMLAVCSSRRRDSCPQADRFVQEATRLGGRARVLPEDLSHGEINAMLGAPSGYTAQVDGFLDSVVR